MAYNQRQSTFARILKSYEYQSYLCHQRSRSRLILAEEWIISEILSTGPPLSLFSQLESSRHATEFGLLQYPLKKKYKLLLATSWPILGFFSASIENGASQWKVPRGAETSFLSSSGTMRLGCERH